MSRKPKGIEKKIVRSVRIQPSDERLIKQKFGTLSNMIEKVIQKIMKDMDKEVM